MTAIRCISGRDIIQSTGSDSHNTSSLPISSCPTTTPLSTAADSHQEKKLDNMKANELPDVAQQQILKKKKRKGKKSVTSRSHSLAPSQPHAPLPSSPRPSHRIKTQFEKIYDRDAAQTVVLTRRQDPQSPLTPTRVRTICLRVGSPGDAEKHYDSDGAAAKAQERLAVYRRSQEQVAILAKSAEEMRRSRRKESRLAIEQAKQRKREETYAANFILALSEANRINMILNRAPLETQDGLTDQSLQQRGV